MITIQSSKRVVANVDYSIADEFLKKEQELLKSRENWMSTKQASMLATITKLISILENHGYKMSSINVENTYSTGNMSGKDWTGDCKLIGRGTIVFGKEYKNSKLLVRRLHDLLKNDMSIEINDWNTKNELGITVSKFQLWV